MAARKKAGARASSKGPKDPLDTPFMRQYLEIKQAYPDTILFFRMGDFYELFLEDAQLAAPLMDVTLTKRQNEIPMAGVPYHSAETYLARLLSAGQRVAIAEQEPDPENPKLMRRRVRRVMTPATLVEESLLGGASHNFLMSVVPGEDCVGVALCDVSTGDFFAQELSLASVQTNDGSPGSAADADDTALRVALRDLYCKYTPREMLVVSDELKRLRAVFPDAKEACVPMESWKASPTEGRRQIEQKFAAKLKGLGFAEDSGYALGAISLILHYVRANFPDSDLQLSAPVYRESAGRTMLLDEQTIRNLDLLQNTSEGGTARTLFGVLDRCHTPTGKRYLREALLGPLLNQTEIEARLDVVAGLADRRELREALSLELKKVYDLERVLTRTATGRGQPRDFVALRNTVAAAVELDALLANAGAALGRVEIPDELSELASEFASTVVEEAPAVLGGGAFVREGVDPELDAARRASEQGSRLVAEFESAERERAGITALRVKYNKIHGYFIEISKGQADQAPADYRRRQTLVGYERFTSDRLEELQTTLLEADEIITKIEARIFAELSAQLLAHADAIKAMMRQLARVDCLLSLAAQAVRHGWARPGFVASAKNSAAGGAELLHIEAGRHPVVEEYLPSGEQFIPNDVLLGRQTDDSRGDSERLLAIITGPNMAGKSTYIRQLGLIQLLAQVGSFVPARAAVLPIVDRIFTRIGAQDNLTRGESTFFVEMLETARILNQCTGRSLVIMDEVGRGTSTYDGISLAWAIVEFLSEPDGPRPLTVFATHYHELTALAERSGVFNLTMDVQERDGQVLFLHRVREGAADRSYGIHVARIAGLPESVLSRAEEKLGELEQDLERDREDTRRKSRSSKAARDSATQAFLF